MASGNKSKRHLVHGFIILRWEFFLFCLYIDVYYLILNSVVWLHVQDFLITKVFPSLFCQRFPSFLSFVWTSVNMSSYCNLFVCPNETIMGWQVRLQNNNFHSRNLGCFCFHEIWLFHNLYCSSLFSLPSRYPWIMFVFVLPFPGSPDFTLTANLLHA